MPWLLFLLKGGVIVILLRQAFLFFWNRVLFNAIHAEAAARGFKVLDISAPGHKLRKMSPFQIDEKHVNKGGDWIYYRIVKVCDKSSTQFHYWVKAVLDKDGNSTTEWKLSEASSRDSLGQQRV